VFSAEELIRHHNPFIRHTIKRRRRDLKAPDGTPYFCEIGIRLHGEDDDEALEMPDRVAETYESARRYCQALARQHRSAGLLRTLLLRRIGGSLAAGLKPAELLLARASTEELSQEEDEEGESGWEVGTETPPIPGTEPEEHLRRAIEALRAASRRLGQSEVN
jgi:hypothetical protein